ncbi:hypothetical protein FBU30_009798 [Linnemannia zychae]|nr:hypothetical protein FBU30_009798 [Linnemannia zychae]
MNNEHHLPRGLPVDDIYGGIQPTTPSTSTEELIAQSHRRNHSSDHITFPKFPVPPPGPAPATTSAKSSRSNSSSTQSSEMLYTLCSQSRSQSMPNTLGKEKEKEKETYTLSDRTSTLLQVTGHVPPPLIGSTTVIHNNRMILFGGRQEGGAPTNNLYVLDLDTLVWELVDLHYHQHQGVQQQHKNETHPNFTAYTQLISSGNDELRHPLSPDTIRQGGESDLGFLSLATYTSSIPQPRYYHSALVVPAPPLFNAQSVLTGWGDENTAHMVIFGGRSLKEDDYGVHETCLNDTHILDLTTLRWISCLNPAEYHHSQPELHQQPLQKVTDMTSNFQDLTWMLGEVKIGSAEMSLSSSNSSSSSSSSDNARTNKLGNFSSVDSGYGIAEQSSLSTSLRHLTPADITFQAGQFSQGRRETSPLRPAIPSTFAEVNSSLTGTPPPIQRPVPQLAHSPFFQHTPRPRFAHTASLNGDHMVIVGGRAQDNTPIQEISVLDLARRVWMVGGDFQFQCCKRMSTLAGVEERPMVRRRRRYLECTTSDQPSIDHSGNLALSTLSANQTTDINSSSLPRLPSTSMPPSPPAFASFLLNPRKNSWHRGEGHPFDTLPINIIPRHRIKSDTELLTGVGQGDPFWQQSTNAQTSTNETQLQGLIGPSKSPEVSEKMPLPAGHPMASDDTGERARQPSVSSTKSSQTNVSKSTKLSAQEAARKRSQSQSSSGTSTPTSPPVPSPNRQSRSKGPVTHAVSKKFFAKSNGGLMDFEDLATTIARESKARPPVRPKVIATTRSRRGSASTSSSSTSTRRGSAATDDSRKTGKTDNRSDRATINDSRSNFSDSRSNINDTRSNTNENNVNVNDSKTEKQQSLDNATKPFNISGISLVEMMEITELTAAAASKKMSYPPLFLFSNYTENAAKPRQELIRVQASRTATSTKSEVNSYDTRSEWTGSYAGDLATRMLASTELAIPPQMLFPEGYIVDHCYLLAGSTAPTTTTTGKSSMGPSQKAEHLNQDMHDGSLSSTANSDRTMYSVWLFHLKTHQWTRLELSKSLSAGNWRQSVLDRDGNYLYLIGAGIKDSQRELAADTIRSTASALTPTTFTHLVKVDLEGFGICPEIDESSMGTNGAKLGLVMLRDGLGADVVLVSSADGGRVKVNSAIVGQRWGYFQDLMKERESKIKHDSVYHHGPRNEYERFQELEDRPVEIVVREPMPILVAFLQYVYTNELSTHHQMKLRNLQGLLLMSHRYDLTRLRQLVLRALHHQLDANNAPVICEIAILANEFGLQTCALRVLLQNARLNQLRQQGEAAEAKRRLDFAMSRLQEIEDDRRRRGSVPFNLSIHTTTDSATANIAATSSGSGASRGKAGSTASSAGPTASLRPGSGPSSTSVSNTSTPGLGSISRFFRHREESGDPEHH